MIENHSSLFNCCRLAHVENASKGENAEIMALAREVLMAGGKRWRPILLLLSYQLAGGKDESEAMPLALAFEMIHTATLVQVFRWNCQA